MNQSTVRRPGSRANGVLSSRTEAKRRTASAACQFWETKQKKCSRVKPDRGRGKIDRETQNHAEEHAII